MHVFTRNMKVENNKNSLFCARRFQSLHSRLGSWSNATSTVGPCNILRFLRLKLYFILVVSGFAAESGPSRGGVFSKTDEKRWWTGAVLLGRLPPGNFVPIGMERHLDYRWECYFVRCIVALHKSLWQSELRGAFCRIYVVWIYILYNY